MKDAKGHGSEKRGGGASAAVAPSYSGKPTWHGVMPGGQKVTNQAGNKISYASPEAAVAGAAHTAGVNKIGIDNPAYTTSQKVSGYTRPVSPLNAIDYNTPGRMLRQRMSDMSKEDHKAAGDAHIAQSQAMKAEHGKIVDNAMKKLGMESPGPLISGIVSDKFSEGTKNRLRDLAIGAGQHTSAAFAHYAASGMRLPTARTRFEGLRGRS
jgi:hypothetical protein